MSQWLANNMEQVLDFSNILNASIAASWMVLAVVVLRFLLKKAPRWTHVALWGLVAVRLLLPFSIESAFSLIPSVETVPQEILRVEGTQLQQPAHFDVVSNPIFSGGASVEVGQTIDRVQVQMVNLSFIWLAGITVLLIYTAISYWRLRRKVSEAVLLRDNIYQGENVGSPFVLGIIKPKVYLSYNMNEQDLSHVVAHEWAHIRRKDHWWKPLGFLLLTIHWFNPVMWLAYVLLCRDIELACDEKVIKELGNEQRADYTQALVACSVNRRMIAACPLAFGEVGVKERVKSVMNYKKPAFWIVVVAVITCAVVAVCFLTNPVAEVELGDIESVTVDNISVSDEATVELVSLINSHRCTPFRVGLDDPNSLSRAIQLNCANGDFYVLHYQYYSGFSFDLRHPGEDDYRSILTFFTAEDGGQKAWKMEYEFDAKLREWLSEYSSPSFGAFSINQPYGVVEVTYESPLMNFSMVAQVNTPEYLVDENGHLFSIREYSESPDWTDLGQLSEITITKENFDELFRNNSGEGWFNRESASAIRSNTAKAWSVIYDQERLYYLLQQKNGELYLAYGYYDYSEKDDPGSDDTYIRWLHKLAPQSAPVSSSVTKWFDYLETPDEMKWDGNIDINLPEFPDVTFRWSYGEIVAVKGNEITSLYTGMPIWNTYFCDLSGDGLPELCSTLSWGSGMIDNRVMIYDYANGVSYSLEDRGVSDYTLRQDESDGYLYVDKKAHLGGALLSTGRLVFEDNCLQVLWPEKPNDNIREITDPTDDPNFAYDTAVEKIFEDANNEYFIGGLYSQHIIVHYTDGTQEDIVTALNAGRATFADLDKFGIRYWAEPKPTSFDIAENTVAEIGRGTLKTAVELSDEDAAGLLSLIESGYWVEAMDTSDCKNDCAVNLGGRLIYYCSECGTFTEYRLSEMSTTSHQTTTSARFWTMPLADQLFVNNILCKYIDLMYGITDVAAPGDDEESCRFYLTIGAEGVKSIELSMPGSSGGCENADGSLFKKGERIWLENLDGYNDLRGLTITALGKNGEIIWSASIPNTAENNGFTHLTQDDWVITNIE